MWMNATIGTSKPPSRKKENPSKSRSRVNSTFARTVTRSYRLLIPSARSQLGRLSVANPQRAGLESHWMLECPHTRPDRCGGLFGGQFVGEPTRIDFASSAGKMTQPQFAAG